MKHIILALFTLHFSLFTSLSATPFAPDPATEVVVYSQESSSPLHVSTIKTNEFDKVVSRTFPPSYTGHRAVCPITRTTTNDDFCAWSGGDTYTPGDPFGVSSARGQKQVELTDMSAITPRVNLWTADNDRAAHGIVETNNITWFSEVEQKIIIDEHGQHIIYITNSFPKKISFTTAPMDRVMVKVSRFLIDGEEIGRFIPGDRRIVYSNTFEKVENEIIHEGNFLEDGKFDIDWDYFFSEIYNGSGVQMANKEVTNVTYKITFGNDPVTVQIYDTNTVMRILPVTISRRFEIRRSIPTPVKATLSQSKGMDFSFRIDNEDLWASQFGTTYTAFKVKVLSGSTEVWNSGIRRLPARDKNGVYTFTTSDSSLLTLNSSLTWRVAVYNSKYSRETNIGMHVLPGDPYSPAQPITAIGD